MRAMGVGWVGVQRVLGDRKCRPLDMLACCVCLCRCRLLQEAVCAAVPAMSLHAACLISQQPRRAPNHGVGCSMAVQLAVGMR
jgi:hypothetical protein